MANSNRSDQVFQLSLTEIAFTITFILLLLLGYLVMRETTARHKAEEELAKVQGLGAAERAVAAAVENLKLGLEGVGASNPDEVISNLVASAQVVAERDRLLAQVRDLEMQVSTLTEIKQLLANAARTTQQAVLVERLVTALAVQSEVERALEDADKAMQSIHVQRSETSDRFRGCTAATCAVGGRTADS
jgi:hypothetical protein